MCILLITTSHPHYPFILINNRDEFIRRPTSRPHWWPSAPHILSSIDLERPEHGTWLGLTRSGRLAVLTNYRESNTHDVAHPVSGRNSRGGMVKAWLTAPEGPTEGMSNGVS